MKKDLGSFVFVLGMLLVVTGWLTGQAAPANAANPGETVYIQFIIDSSLSMRQTIAPRQSRLDVAKACLIELISGLPDNGPLEVALRVYGANLVPNNPCRDSVLVQDFGPLAEVRESIIAQVGALRPRGMTPIAYSLEEAAKDFPHVQGRNIIVLLTDGAESCRGNPCEVARSLQAQGFILEPYVIGFALSEREEALVSCIGRYYSANDLESLRNALTQIMQEAMSPTLLTLEAWSAGVPLAEPVSFHIYEKGVQVAEGQGPEAVFNLQPGEYDVRAQLWMESQAVTTYVPGVRVLERQTTHALVDFGPLSGEVTITARAGDQDVSESVLIEVFSRERAISSHWQGRPLTTHLAAGNYRFVITHHEFPELHRTVVAWIPPDETTHIHVDLGEPPAGLTVQVVFNHMDITPLCTLRVLEEGQVRTNLPIGNSVFVLEREAGEVDLLIGYEGDVHANRTVSGVVLPPGTATHIVVDFSDLLSIVRVQVLAGSSNVTEAASVIAQGPSRLALPLKDGYREAIVLAGAYLLEASYTGSPEVGVVELLVEAGQIYTEVINLAAPGTLVLTPFLGNTPGNPLDFECHLWQGDDYIVQLVAGDNHLSEQVAPGTYSVEGIYLGDASQRRELHPVHIESGQVTEVNMIFAGMGLLQFAITTDGQPYDDVGVDVYVLDGAWESSAYQTAPGLYACLLPEGFYRVEITSYTLAMDTVTLEVEVVPNQDRVYPIELGGVGILEVSILRSGEWSEVRYVAVYTPDGQFVSVLGSVIPGEYRGEFLSGTYDVIIEPVEQALSTISIPSVSLRSGETTRLDVSFSDLAPLEVYITMNQRPQDVTEVSVFDKQGGFVAGLFRTAEGVYTEELAPGVYDLYVVTEFGSILWFLDITVAPGQTNTQSLDLRAFGTLVITLYLEGMLFDYADIATYTPEWTPVYWVDEGTYEGELLAGTHEIHISYWCDEQEDYVTGTYEVSLNAGETQEMVVRLE